MSTCLNVGGCMVIVSEVRAARVVIQIDVASITMVPARAFGCVSIACVLL